MQPPLANVFQPLINVFDAILGFFHDDIGLGWGLAIVALTLLIRSLLLPLTLKQLRSMYRMAQFTPEIKKLREKHGSDPKRLQRETLAFYKENRINPLGSGPAGAGAAAGLPFAVLPAAHRPAARHLPPSQSARHVEPTAVRRDGGAALPLHPGPDQSRHGRRSRRTDRALRRLATLLVPALGEPDDGQDATDDLHRAALLLHRDRLAAAGRSARVLDHHEHVDDRPGRDRAQAPGSPAPGGAGRAGGSGRTWRAGSSLQAAARRGPRRATAFGPPAAHQRRLDDGHSDRLGRAPQQGGLAPRVPAAASERPPAGAAPPQEEALRSTPVSRRDPRQADCRPDVRPAEGSSSPARARITHGERLDDKVRACSSHGGAGGGSDGRCGVEVVPAVIGRHSARVAARARRPSVTTSAR